MIFTEIDKTTMQTLTTLVKLSSPIKERKSAIVRTGQYLGVPKADTLELIQDWDEFDTIELQTADEKQRFLNECFAFMSDSYVPRKSDKELYSHVMRNLGLDQVR